MADCETIGHCWHAWTINLDVTPPAARDRCCWCGAIVNKRTRNPWHDLKEHGPHAPLSGADEHGA